MYMDERTTEYQSCIEAARILYEHHYIGHRQYMSLLEEIWADARKEVRQEREEPCQ